MIVGALMDVSSCKKCYFGVFRWFCLGHRPWPDELRGAGKHARAPGDATPQSACSAGKQSRSATLSTPGVGRGAGPTWRGRNMGSGPDFDFMGAAHGNPGRVWQRSGKPGC